MAKVVRPLKDRSRHFAPVGDRRGIGRSVIVVGTADLCAEIAKAVGNGDVDVVGFRSLAELDRWRAAHGNGHDERMHDDVIAALVAVGHPLETLPEPLRKVVVELGEGSTVPDLAELAARWPSRRSFYRVWSESIGETPSVFLRRVRALHAQRLIDGGASRKEAASRSGFGSVGSLRRNLRGR
ncbi:MAG TPA: helix-turn-helix domain-containing protein [Thermoanaerobaculia bacterium]|nr:helix-turn-helix domain-containing protein [Thermoanaerobaculia bacterium]